MAGLAVWQAPPANGRVNGRGGVCKQMNVQRKLCALQPSPMGYHRSEPIALLVKKRPERLKKTNPQCVNQKARLRKWRKGQRTEWGIAIHQARKHHGGPMPMVHLTGCWAWVHSQYSCRTQLIVGGRSAQRTRPAPRDVRRSCGAHNCATSAPVSYTHLTLPTNREV